MPRMVGVVTSRDGAAFQDFLRTRSLRWPLYPVRLAHTSVQGVGAAREIADAIRRIDRSGVDVIALIRGGGSLEDLWAFNELAVAEAIWGTRAPVVSGVGHETDVTLADLVADHRAHTPTDAAQTVLPDRAALVDEIERLANHLMQAIDEAIAEREERLSRAARSGVLRDARALVDVRARSLEHAARALRMSLSGLLARAASGLEQSARRLQCHDPRLALEKRNARLARIEPRLSAAIGAALASSERRLDLAASTLASVSPFSVLARGYSITRRAGEDAPLTEVAGLRPGERVETRLFHGWIASTIEALGGADGVERGASE
jgi:exodeoxyribonuclease VII large subunit